MEKKEFSELSLDDKITLLNHWLMYYGKVPVSLDVLEKIHNLINTDTETIMNIALFNYAHGEGSSILIMAVKRGMFDELGEMANELKEKAMKSDDSLKAFVDLENAFLDEVITTYNNPEPDIPMDLGQILAYVLDEDSGNNGYVEHADDSMESMESLNYLARVNKVFFDSLFNDDEVVDNKAIVPYVLGEGVISCFGFNAERLNKNKEEIERLIGELPLDFSKPTNFVQLCLLKNGSQWCDLHSDIEKIIALGVACGIVSYTAPRDEWEETLGVPEVVLNGNRKRDEITGRSPEMFTEDIKQYTKKKDNI